MYLGQCENIELFSLDIHRENITQEQFYLPPPILYISVLAMRWIAARLINGTLKIQTLSRLSAEPRCWGCEDLHANDCAVDTPLSEGDDVCDKVTMTPVY